MIATEYQGVGEALEHGRTGYLVPAKGKEAFHSAIRELYLDACRRQQMSRHAQAFARERYCSAAQNMKALDAIKYFHAKHLGLEQQYA